MSYMNIGQRIKQARLSRRPKMTQQQLADAIFISRPAVTQWETGETKTLEGENLLRVAKALEVSPEWLMYGTGPGPGFLESRSKPIVNAAANDDEAGLSRRALMFGQVFDQLTPDQQDALQVLFESLTQQKAEEVTKKA